MAENRIRREAETRDAEARPRQWTPPETMPNPEPRDGIEFRWIRVANRGQVDPKNIASKLREGWEPCKADQFPEYDLIREQDNSRFKDNVLVGGLLLCSMPTEMINQRRAYYEAQTARQMQTVNNNLMAEQDPRMPVFNNSRSQVSFGR